MYLRVISLLAPIFLGIDCNSQPPAAGEGQLRPSGQLGQSFSWIPVDPSKKTFLLGQVTRDGKLILTPNEAFFPKLGLVAAGQGNVPDIDNLNGGQSFSSIEKWDAGDVAQWGLHFKSPGNIRIRVWMSAAKSGATFSISLNDQKQTFDVDGTGQVAMVTDTEFTLTRSGLTQLNLICEASAPGLALHRIEVSGAAAIEAAVVRKRWRPAAAHTRFSSSKTDEDVRMWVMEMDALPGELDFYSPITTPFGYYGPTWRADGSVNSSFNFSLWSYRRGAPEPPVKELSHLLAVGDPHAEFGGFGHEGTGVKVRSWEPLQGQQGQRQVLALRVQPGEIYDTYYSYFYAAKEKRWRLFGIGNKFNQGKPVRSLWVGSFVEVPGRPHVQRSGSVPRVMRYRGWIMTESGKWFPLDQMSNGNVNHATQLTHTDRGIMDEWFYLKTGGWLFRKPDRSPMTTQTDPTNRAAVDYLSDNDIAFLSSVPSEIVVTEVQRDGDRADVRFQVAGVARDAQVTAFWGTGDSLTLAERWENRRSFDRVDEGANSLEINGVPRDAPIFIRLLLTNSEGKYWTAKTATAMATTTGTPD